MFQTFDVTASPNTGRTRVEQLRSSFETLGIDCLLVPRSDRFQGEYVPESEARLAWLTGFTGSAGAAVIMQDTAHVFVDGRYTTQVRQQIDLEVFTPQDLVTNPPAKWLLENARTGLRIGIDPWLHTLADVRRLEKTAEQIGAKIIKLNANPIDAIWTDRPAEPLGPASIQPLQFAGRLSRDKLADIQDMIGKAEAGACVISDPSSIAWLFNIRGSDVAHTPLALAFAIITPTGTNALFIDRRKLDRETAAYLTQMAGLFEPAELEARLADMGEKGTAVMVDPDLVASRIADLVTANGGRLIEKADPARLPRAQKNAAELEGSRAAHLRDGAAMVAFLSWLDAQSAGTVDEITAVRTLEKCRRVTGERLQMPLREISFDTISGSGPNGAIIHYRVTTQTNRTMKPGELYLVDSGAQFQDGTTDITRTIAIGDVGETEKRFFTLVLKGMIALSLMRFPEATRGMDIDAIARAALWKAGADYGHGTGHGVGSYLSVHEGPQNISRRGVQELKPGMILSNEPGYYREGGFGIRIENLIIVEEATRIQGGDKPMLGFETLTLCPIDRRLVVPALLSGEELHWLNAYHARVLEAVSPLLETQQQRDWLASATAPIG